MSSGRRIGSRDVVTPNVDIVTWVQVDADALPAQRRAQFLQRRSAITIYLGGASDDELRRSTGLARSNVYRLIVDRCLAPHPDGTLMGWRGALPYVRIRRYQRTAPVKVNPSTGGGAVAALRWLFESPGGAELEARFRKQILGKRPSLAATRRPKRDLFNWFIKQLRAKGLEARGEWPFNVERMGYVSICRYIDHVLTEDPSRHRQLLGGEDAQRKARAGDGSDRPALRLFERVECDAHKLDARMVVLLPSPHGGYEARPIHRLWVVVIIEVASRAVLGYHLSLHRECDAEDVLRALKCALSVWRPRSVQFSDHAYVDGAGLPSARHERYRSACWDEFSVDGAMANICERVERPLREIVGASVIKPQDTHCFASRRSLDDRPFIESFFRRLAQGGFHRLSPTTGSAPKDKRGGDPEAAAMGARFQLEYAEELLDTLIANYNATPHSGLGYRSPLAQMDFLATREDARIRHADAAEVRRVVGIRKLCTVKSGIATGRRPHFNFENARYSAEWLAQRTDLIGKLLWLHIEDEDDARWATVSTQRGEFLGAVRAAPPWHRTPHTLYMRQAIRALDKTRRLHLSSACDAVEELIRYAEESAGRKLPPHPAYLEARRVLQQHAQKLTDEPMVAQPRSPASTEAGSPGTVAPGPRDQPASERPPRRLPRMQMAKIW